jgi:hypothetical protein
MQYSHACEVAPADPGPEHPLRKEQRYDSEGALMGVAIEWSGLLRASPALAWTLRANGKWKAV